MYTRNHFFILLSAPGLAPANLTSYNKTSTSITLQWSPVPTEHQNGVILGYYVKYNLSSPHGNKTVNITVPPNKLSVELSKLAVFTFYFIRVSAFTSAGVGPDAVLGETTDQEGETNSETTSLLFLLPQTVIC